MSYVIDHYPAELIDVVYLAGGQRVTVRPFLPQDASILQAFVRGLSLGSRRARFLRAVSELPDALLVQLTSIDYHRHMALLAEVFLDGVEVIIGEARYAVSDDPGAAEFAVTVAESWRHQGVGQLLLGRLEQRAAAEGITVLYGDSLRSNTVMQALASKTGYTLARHVSEPDLLRVSKNLPRVSPQAGIGVVSAIEPPQTDGGNMRPELSRVPLHQSAAAL
jgi:acetyltransferase